MNKNSVVQQFTGASIIKGYVVKIFGEVYNRETSKRLAEQNLSMRGN